jgi:hypothetical protein
MAAMSSRLSLPLLRARPSQRPYPLLDLLWGTTLVRRELCEGRAGVPLRLALRLLNPADRGRPFENAAAAPGATSAAPRASRSASRRSVRPCC